MDIKPIKHQLNMRYCILIIILSFFTLNANSQNTYEAEWSTVEGHLKKQRNKDAEAGIKQILAKARKDDNKEQIIKSLCMLRLAVADRDEKNFVSNIIVFENELSSLGFPEKNLVHSLLANMYSAYYQNHRWKIYKRTEVADKKELLAPEDIESWTPQHFFTSIHEHYDASLNRSEDLFAINTSKYKVLITEGTNTEGLRPTLYDILVHRAIDYYTQDEIDITKAAYFFELKDADDFSEAQVFRQKKYSDRDAFSSKLIALKYFQKALDLHSSSYHNSMTDLDLRRLSFVHNKSVHPDKDSLYNAALRRLIKNYKSDRLISKAKIRLAQQLNRQSKKAEAIEICNDILENHSKSLEEPLAQNLKNQIKRKSLSLSTEKGDVAQENILTKLSYTNVDKVWLKVIRLSYEEYKKRHHDYRSNKQAPKGEGIKNWTVALPQKGDYQSHSTEIKTDGLSDGWYAVVACGGPSFNPKQHPVAYSLIQISNLSFVRHRAPGNTRMYVVDRENGAPITGATVNLWSNKYNYKTRKNELIKVDMQTSDANGAIDVAYKSRNNRMSVEIIKGAQKLWDNDGMSTRSESKPRSRERIYFFTDRAIYRPGQIIYFKGIVVNSNSNQKEHNVVLNKKVKVELKDANYQLVKSKNFTTNEFGSISGSFKAPDGLLNGRFQLHSSLGNHSIRVEEYKRPKFEVKLDSLEKNVKLNEEVEVSGKALAYAGNNIGGAKVKYRIMRKVRWPYYWSYYRWCGFMPRNSPEVMISTGETTTDENGKFNISFFAKGDNAVDLRSRPIYMFEVSADVSDINGETHSKSYSYSISNESLLLSLESPKEVDINQFNSVDLSTTNVQGKHTSANVSLSLTKLQAPESFLKKRLWGKPDLYSMNASEFKKHFPQYAYKDEADPLNWKKGRTVWTKDFKTTSSGKVILQKTGSGSGYYLLQAKTRDKDGKEILEKKVVRLLNANKPQALANEELLVWQDKKSVQPNQNVKLSLSSNFNNAHIHQTIIRNNEVSHTWNAKNRSFKISEKDRGGFFVSYFTVHNNRLYFKNQSIAVPWTNKDLNISYESFRDKLRPGQEQEWTIKISGPKKEVVSAELLTTMYDASLDAFVPNNWNKMKLFANNYMRSSWSSPAFGTGLNRMHYEYSAKYKNAKSYQYPRLQFFGLEYGGNRYRTYAFDAVAVSAESSAPPRGRRLNTLSAPMPKSSRESKKMKAVVVKSEHNAVSGDANSDAANEEDEAGEAGNGGKTEGVVPRKNMSETAYFHPQLKTDAEGNIIFSFKAPEALTRWNLKTLAHTKDMKTASLSKTLVTQKELMVVPNHPRFVREGDKMYYSAKISNLTDKRMNATATLDFINAKTNQSINDLFSVTQRAKKLNIEAEQSNELNWMIDIPSGYTDPIIVKILSSAGKYSDGEQVSIPVLLNSMLVTETLPLPVRANTTKNFSFDKLKNSGQSSTLKHHGLTLEYTSNPAWYAVQALPYLTDYPYECAEQTFNRYYANILASHIANSSPKIKTIFSKWKETDTAALMSNLEKNQELKYALLQETPWVMDAKNESEQKRRIALLFDLNRMSTETAKNINDLKKLQTSNGGFSWFKGMRDNRFITQYILTGIGRLKHLGVSKSTDDMRDIIRKAIPYLDARMQEDYNRILRNKLLGRSNYGYGNIQYLYMRSFFPEMPVPVKNKIAFNYFKNQTKKHWTKQNKYMQGLSAISLNRFEEKGTAKEIIEALRQNAIHKEEMGMYWKELNRSYWWYEAPIEAHSVLIEAFKEVNGDDDRYVDEVDELKIWLLKQKQTQHWKTTKATADACYALLLEGTDWLAAEPEVEVQMGSKVIDLKAYKQEAGTGYTKVHFGKSAIKPEMGNIRVSVKTDKKVGTTWGAVYWQYFEQLDKITSAETPLSLKKQVYKVIDGDRGEELVLIKENQKLNVGDKVKVRIELRVDRPMEFVHMKDMRGACFEPTNVLSNYKYQNGLGYYESTKDASTQFFFDYLNPGTYVFEYPMFATIKGDYSNGIATIQCMYAPEFSSHSEGIRIKVD